MKNSPLLKLSIGLNVVLILLIVYLQGKKYYYSHRPVVKDPHEFHSDWNAVRIAALNGFPITSNDIVFIGTSLTEGFPVNEAFAGLPVKNRGISSNTTANIAGRIDTIAAGHPKVIFLEGGINDIRTSVPADSIIINYQKTLGIIKSKSPKTKVYVQTVMPTFNNQAFYNPQVQALNKKIAAMCVKDSITLIDLNSAFVPGPKYSVDGIHFTTVGYKVWADKIRPFVK